MKLIRFVVSRLQGGAWAELPPLLPKAKVIPITVRRDSGVFPHRRAC